MFGKTVKNELKNQIKLLSIQKGHYFDTDFTIPVKIVSVSIISII
jgi:hypothetical protein